MVGGGRAFEDLEEGGEEDVTLEELEIRAIFDGVGYPTQEVGAGDGLPKPLGKHLDRLREGS